MKFMGGGIKLIVDRWVRRMEFRVVIYHKQTNDLAREAIAQL